jgi:flavodoxin
MKNDILIAYYSWSGNTRKIAGLIERATGGTLFEIEPVQPLCHRYDNIKSVTDAAVHAETSGVCCS